MSQADLEAAQAHAQSLTLGELKGAIRKLGHNIPPASSTVSPTERRRELEYLLVEAMQAADSAYAPRASTSYSQWHAHKTSGGFQPVSTCDDDVTQVSSVYDDVSSVSLFQHERPTRSMTAAPKHIDWCCVTPLIVTVLVLGVGMMGLPLTAAASMHEREAEDSERPGFLSTDADSQPDPARGSTVVTAHDLPSLSSLGALQRLSPHPSPTAPPHPRFRSPPSPRLRSIVRGPPSPFPPPPPRLSPPSTPAVHLTPSLKRTVFQSPFPPPRHPPSPAPLRPSPVPAPPPTSPAPPSPLCPWPPRIPPPLAPPLAPVVGRRRYPSAEAHIDDLNRRFRTLPYRAPDWRLLPRTAILVHVWDGWEEHTRPWHAGGDMSTSLVHAGQHNPRSFGQTMPIFNNQVRESPPLVCM